MTKHWRVGVLSLGNWYSANGLARALAEDPRAELVAEASPDPEKRAAYAATFGIAAHETPDELLARPAGSPKGRPVSSVLRLRPAPWAT